MSKVFLNIKYTTPRPASYLKGEDRADYLARRSFYNLTSDYNYLSYMLSGKKTQSNKDVFEYYTRNNKQEGDSTGLFNLKGAIDKEGFEELKAKISTTESIIWHGFVSFDQPTSKGLRTEEQAQKFMKQTFNIFLERTHLDKKNIEMFAILHTDTDHHHHIHFSFFEKEAKRINKHGELCFSSKGNVNQKAIDNYLVAANMHMSESANEYYTVRDRLFDKLNELRAKGTKRLERPLKVALYELSAKLPTEGRLQYLSPNMKEHRAEIDKIALMMLRANPKAWAGHLEMERQLAQKEIEVRELIGANKLAYVDGERLTKNDIRELLSKGRTGVLAEKYADLSNIDYIDKLRLDYRARLGNQVLKLIKQQKRDDFEMRRQYRHLKMEARKNRYKTARCLKNGVRDMTSFGDRIRADFTKTFKQIEAEIAFENREHQSA
ncbi:MAG: hypothetical protein FWC80_03385 [Firmicutes bacterium]|nr:hypothetical protein [Bacillota bacterium]